MKAEAGDLFVLDNYFVAANKPISKGTLCMILESVKYEILESVEYESQNIPVLLQDGRIVPFSNYNLGNKVCGHNDSQE